MDILDYQLAAGHTSYYPSGYEYTYPMIGLSGEVGEVAEHIKKMIRDDGGVLTPERKELLSGELGDVLWYLATLASALGLDLDAIASENLDKVNKRFLARKEALL